jgi:CheY-like chemotaxis protein
VGLDKPPPKRSLDEYRQFFKTPETPHDFWQALKFELDIGANDLALRHLRGFLDKKPSDADLMQIEEEDGMTAFLRLRNVQWSPDAKLQADTLKAIDDLITRVTEAVKKQRGDPKRIEVLIRGLSASPEERAYSLKELYRAGAAAVPHLISGIRNTTGSEHIAILSALLKLGPDTIPPLEAALDIEDAAMRIELIDVLQKRAAKRSVPFLWHLASGPEQSQAVREKATEALSNLLGVPPNKLPAGRAALTREADRYYNHEVKFPNPAAVAVWRWDAAKKELVQGWPGAETVPATRAEEYYGLLFAGQALAIDPEYQPAQVEFLSIALDKGMEKTGYEKPLTQAAPEVSRLLSTVNPELVNAVLERALADKRVPVMIGAARALGDLAELRAARPTGHGQPALVRALSYPDRRVQMAAADAYLRIGAVPTPGTASRIVDILTRAVGVEPAARAGAKVMVAFGSREAGEAVSRAVSAAGFSPVRAFTGRDALRRLGQAADIDLLIIDANLPDPGLASLLGQLRSDVNYGRLPLLLVAPQVTREALLRERLKAENELQSMARRRDRLVLQRERVDRDLISAPRDVVLDLEVERERLGKELVAVSFQREQTLRGDLRRLDQELLTAPRDRTDSLLRLTEGYANLQVVSEAAVRDVPSLRRMIVAQAAEDANQPLTETERQEYAERALVWLGRMARGEVAGYDIQPAAEAIVGALGFPKLSNPAMLAALEAAARLPAEVRGVRPQTKLAAFILDGDRSPALRSATATELVRSIQLHGPTLTDNEAKNLAALLDAQGTDPKLRVSVALVVGSLRPDTRRTGERLRQFQPPQPAPPAKPAEK